MWVKKETRKESSDCLTLPLPDSSSHTVSNMGASFGIVPSP